MTKTIWLLVGALWFPEAEMLSLQTPVFLRTREECAEVRDRAAGIEVGGAHWAVQRCIRIDLTVSRARNDSMRPEFYPGRK